jgi:hypothetical protein
MIEYIFKKEDVLKSGIFDYFIVVKKPYELLGDCIDSDRTSQYVGEIIDGLTKVSTGENPDYSWQSQSGVLIFVGGYDASITEDPEGGCYIYSLFDDDENPKFKISISEMIQMLTEFKEFLIKNKR